MINEIEIDTRDLSSQFEMSKGDIDGLLQYTVQQLTAEFAYIWGNEAKSNLHSSRAKYLNAIQVTERGRFTGVAYLNPAAWLPNAIETGATAFDMKVGFLRSSKVKMGKSGPYITIPFRFGTSGSIGESEAFAGVMPPEIERATKSSSGPLKMGNIPSKYHIPKSAALRKRQESISFKKMESMDKTSIYEGIEKRGGSYINFRRVSLNSSADAFQHPGFEARDLAGKALPKLDIEGITGSAIDQFLINLGF